MTNADLPVATDRPVQGVVKAETADVPARQSRTSRHRDVDTLKAYDRRAKLFKDHAGKDFLWWTVRTFASRSAPTSRRI